MTDLPPTEAEADRELKGIIQDAGKRLTKEHMLRMLELLKRYPKLASQEYVSCRVYPHLPAIPLFWMLRSIQYSGNGIVQEVYNIDPHALGKGGGVQEALVWAVLTRTSHPDVVEFFCKLDPSQITGVRLRYMKGFGIRPLGTSTSVLSYVLDRILKKIWGKKKLSVLRVLLRHCPNLGRYFWQFLKEVSKPGNKGLRTILKDEYQPPKLTATPVTWDRLTSAEAEALTTIFFPTLENLHLDAVSGVVSTGDNPRAPDILELLLRGLAQNETIKEVAIEALPKEPVVASALLRAGSWERSPIRSLTVPLMDPVLKWVTCLPNLRHLRLDGQVAPDHETREPVVTSALLRAGSWERSPIHTLTVPLMDPVLKWVTCLPNLRHLRLDGQVTPGHETRVFDLLGDLPKLESIGVDAQVETRSRMIEAWRSHPSLRVLDTAYYHQLSLEDLEAWLDVVVSNPLLEEIRPGRPWEVGPFEDALGSRLASPITSKRNALAQKVTFYQDLNKNGRKAMRSTSTTKADVAGLLGAVQHTTNQYRLSILFGLLSEAPEVWL